MVEEISTQQRNNKGQFIKGSGRWKPGESGNPGGRHKDPGITAIQIEMLDKPCPYAKDPKTTWRMWLAEKGLLLAGDKEAALRDLKDRLEGKVTLPIGGDKENPIYTITVSSEGGKKDIERLLNGERT